MYNTIAPKPLDWPAGVPGATIDLRRSLPMRILTTLAVATMFANTAAAQAHEHPPTPVPPSAESEQAFKLIKSVSGLWQGRVTEPVNKLDAAVDVALRVTSRGNLVVHEI